MYMIHVYVRVYVCVCVCMHACVCVHRRIHIYGYLEEVLSRLSLLEKSAKLGEERKEFLADFPKCILSEGAFLGEDLPFGEET